MWKARRKVATSVEKPQCVHFLPDHSAIRLIAPVWTHRRNKKKTVGPTLCHHHVSSDELGTAAVTHRFIHYAPHPFTRRPSCVLVWVTFRYNSLIWNGARMHALTHAGRRLPERETHHQPMMTGHKRICRIEYEPNKSQQRKKPLAPGPATTFLFVEIRSEPWPRTRSARGISRSFHHDRWRFDSLVCRNKWPSQQKKKMWRTEIVGWK